jgi:hypothetical protein
MQLLALVASLVLVRADEGFSNFFDLTATDISGNPQPFDQYRSAISIILFLQHTTLHDTPITLLLREQGQSCPCR